MQPLNQGPPRAFCALQVCIIAGRAMPFSRSGMSQNASVPPTLVQYCVQYRRRPGRPRRVSASVRARQRRQALAAMLLWHDDLTDEQIAARCGVSRRTLARWKQHPFVQTAFYAYQAAWNERRRRAGWQPRKGTNRRPLCGAKTRAGTPCRMVVVEGRERCCLHGGMSTGPKTAEGRARIAESNRRRAEVNHAATARHNTCWAALSPVRVGGKR